MWMIVFYHFHTHVLQYGSDSIIFRAIQIPIHIAVICFILISGYFGINASIKGFSKLFSKIMFYALSIMLIVFLYGKFSGNPIYYSTNYISQFVFDKGLAINSSLFISRSPLWFIRSYLLLYIISPFLNNILINQSKQERMLLLIVFGFITFWIDLLRDDGMGGGKNLIDFCFLYFVGRSIKEYDIINKVSAKLNYVLYLCLTVLIVVLFVVFDGSVIGSIIGVLSFRYNGLFCILSAILFFMIFARMHFYSKWINNVSFSVFAVYLIHEHPLLNNYIYSIVDYWQQNNGISILYAYLILYSITVIVISVIIDEITLPIQNALASITSMFLLFWGRKLGMIENE